MLYFFIVLITMILVEGISVLCSVIYGTSIVYALVMPFFVNAWVLVVLGIVALITRLLFPKRVWNYRLKFYRVSPKEMKFYRNIKVKAWKEKIPEMGWTGGFPKDKLASQEVPYLFKFLQETCYAEVMHLLSAFLGFTVLFVLPVQDYLLATPILLVNVVLHILPCIIQRYNRNRLEKVYQFRLSKEKFQAS